MHIRYRTPPFLARQMGYEKVRDFLWELADTFPACRLRTIGTTAGGRSMYAAVLGEEESRTVAYMGGLSGGDWVSTAVLLRFLWDYCALLSEGGRLYSVHLPYLYANRRILVCPAVNCDAMDGEEPANCGFCNSFGGDIRRFFGDTAEAAERCPEASAVKQYLHYEDPALFLSLQGDGVGKLRIPDGTAGRSGTVGRLLSRMIALPVEKGCSGEGDGSGVPEWFAAAFSRPAYEASLGAAETEDGFYEAYAAAREALFSLPLLV